MHCCLAHDWGVLERNGCAKESEMCVRLSWEMPVSVRLFRLWYISGVHVQEGCFPTTRVYQQLTNYGQSDAIQVFSSRISGDSDDHVMHDLALKRRVILSTLADLESFFGSRLWTSIIVIQAPRRHRGSALSVVSSGYGSRGMYGHYQGEDCNANDDDEYLEIGDMFVASKSSTMEFLGIGLGVMPCNLICPEASEKYGCGSLTGLQICENPLGLVQLKSRIREMCEEFP
ncbi:hypothetical protein Tco_1576986 [Tanacetum coccineum]